MFITQWDSARRAWKFQTRRSFPVVLRLMRRFIKRLVHPISTPTPVPPHYAERQFSFNDTPVFHLKLHRRRPPPWFSCINPKPEFENCVVDVDVDVDVGDDGGWDRRLLCGGASGYEGEEEEDGIDLKAEKFIKMFYEQMKMQSQVS